MAETVTLAAAETPPSNPSYRIASIHEDWINGTIAVTLIGVNGETKTATYGSWGLFGANGQKVAGAPTGAALLIAQNKANFSVNSRQKAIYTRLIADGVVTGTIAGAPD